MSSRDEILNRVKQHQQEDVLPTEPFADGMVFEDPLGQFAEMLASIGGQCIRVASVSEADQRLRLISEYSSAEKTCSLAEGVGATSFDLASVTDPHEVEDVDFTVVPGEYAVAENAAVWVTADDPVHRVLHFLTQHLALVVPSDRVLSNLHEAYERIEVGKTPFGTWISGPSKTADIEQSLVKGAHGSRTLVVFLIDELS